MYHVYVKVTSTNLHPILAVLMNNLDSCVFYFNVRVYFATGIWIYCELNIEAGSRDAG
jgi:hypothetical protein